MISKKDLSTYSWRANRFSNTTELMLLNVQFQNLVKKVDHLFSTGKSAGVHSLEYKKYLVLSDFTKEIYLTISKFNNQNTTKDRIKTFQDIKVLLLEMLQHVLNLNVKDIAILLQPRNSHKKVANSLIYVTTLGAGISGGILSGGLIGGLAGFFGGALTGDICSERAGLSSEYPDSLNKLFDFIHTLMKSLSAVLEYLDELKIPLTIVDFTKISSLKSAIKETNEIGDNFYIYPQNKKVCCVYQDKAHEKHHLILNDFLKENEEKNLGNDPRSALIMTLLRGMYCETLENFMPQQKFSYLNYK